MKMYDLPGAYKDMQMTHSDIDVPINKNIDFQETVISPAPELSQAPSNGNTNQFPLKWILYGGGLLIVGITVYNEFQKNMYYTSNRRRRILSYN